jgi:hypothetical protein
VRTGKIAAPSKSANAQTKTEKRQKQFFEPKGAPRSQKKFLRAAADKTVRPSAESAKGAPAIREIAGAKGGQRKKRSTRNRARSGIKPPLYVCPGCKAVVKANPCPECQTPTKPF